MCSVDAPHDILAQGIVMPVTSEENPTLQAGMSTSQEDQRLLSSSGEAICYSCTSALPAGATSCSSCGASGVPVTPPRRGFPSTFEASAEHVIRYAGGGSPPTSLQQDTLEQDLEALLAADDDQDFGTFECCGHHSDRAEHGSSTSEEDQSPTTTNDGALHRGDLPEVLPDSASVVLATRIARQRKSDFLTAQRLRILWHTAGVEVFGYNPWHVEGRWPPRTVPAADADDLRLYNAVRDLGDPLVPGWFVRWALQNRISSAEQIRRIGLDPTSSPASSSHSSDILPDMNTPWVAEAVPRRTSRRVFNNFNNNFNPRRRETVPDRETESVTRESSAGELATAGLSASAGSSFPSPTAHAAVDTELVRGSEFENLGDQPLRCVPDRESYDVLYLYIMLKYIYEMLQYVESPHCLYIVFTYVHSI